MTVSALLGCALVLGAACGGSAKTNVPAGAPGGGGSGNTTPATTASSGGGYGY